MFCNFRQSKYLCLPCMWQVFSRPRQRHTCLHSLSAMFTFCVYEYYSWYFRKFWKSVLSSRWIWDSRQLTPGTHFLHDNTYHISSIFILLCGLFISLCFISYNNLWNSEYVKYSSNYHYTCICVYVCIISGYQKVLKTIFYYGRNQSS